MTKPTRQHLRSEIDRLIARYFSDPARTRVLADGEVLIEEGKLNDRLYYVREGELAGHAHEATSPTESWLYAGQGDLVGIKSFFDEQQLSQATVVARGACTVAWVTVADIAAQVDVAPEKELMPLFVHTLNRRQRHVYELMQQEQAAQARAAELAQAGQLGQFAAGVAHELNNALAVIARGTHWLSGALVDHMSRLGDLEHQVFNAGLRQGHHVPSRTVREQAQQLQQRLGLRYTTAKRLASMGLDDDLQQRVEGVGAERHLQLTHSWEIGATFRDLAVSAEQAGQVVESMKNLGASASRDAGCVDLTTSIESALTILRNVTRGIEVELTPPVERACIRGNKGEMVQVWTNLIKNACDALHQRPRAQDDEPPRIAISLTLSRAAISVRVADNGPGIPDAVRSRIFEPSFTTKKSGLHFGLGLGLSIVRKIVSGYGGSVAADGGRSGAVFTVVLPRSGCEGCPEPLHTSTQ